MKLPTGATSHQIVINIAEQDGVGYRFRKQNSHAGSIGNCTGLRRSNVLYARCPPFGFARKSTSRIRLFTCPLSRLIFSNGSWTIHISAILSFVHVWFVSLGFFSFPFCLPLPPVPRNEGTIYLCTANTRSSCRSSRRTEWSRTSRQLWLGPLSPASVSPLSLSGLRRIRKERRSRISAKDREP